MTPADPERRQPAPPPDLERAPAPRRGRGRPSRTESETGPGTRDRILTAAREQFAERGYDKASIRSIAKSAGVDPALVHHYFGTKDDVFAAAIEASFEPVAGGPQALAAGIVGPGPEGAGERLARSFFAVWENPTTRVPLLAVVRSAVTHERAAKALRNFVLKRLIERVESDLHVPDPRFRAELAASHMVGIAMLRYVVKIEPLASADPEDIIALVAPTLQRYLTEA
ncbi:TetR family transcriptional regulator [Streptomyces sp. KLOTTS4A1]|uniref:TetR/AcrR family transcriptional regulator n=1 Tax=Streptomyces sp. KLOTTS4A1 TaxID=3390996 RepID=UPI0039F535D7